MLPSIGQTKRCASTAPSSLPADSWRSIRGLSVVIAFSSLQACEVTHQGSPDRGKIAELGRYCDSTQEQAADAVRAAVQWERCTVIWVGVEDKCFRVRGDRRSQWHDQILQIRLEPAPERQTVVWFERGSASVCMVHAFADRLDQALELIGNGRPLPPWLPPPSRTIDG